MTDLMHDVARAALPVAIGLLTCAAAARAVVWSGFDDAQAQRLARQYLAPFCTWCLVALATHVVALGAAGEASALSLLLPLALGAAAALLRRAPEPEAKPAPAEPARATTRRPAAASPAPTRTPAAPTPKPPARNAPAPTAPAPAATRPAAAPAMPTGRLWADRTEDEATRTGLWSRA